MTTRWLNLAGVLAVIASECMAAGLTELNNGTVTLKLGFEPGGAAIIRQAAWSRDRQPIFEGVDLPDGMKSWLLAGMLSGPRTDASDLAWKVADDQIFLRGEAARDLGQGLRLTWAVELTRRGSLLRLSARLANRGDQPRAIESFPAWTACWRLPGGAEQVRGWNALSFQRVEQALTAGREATFGSRLHSSDRVGGAGSNPYWMVPGKNGVLYFGLAWCGGWEARLKGESDGLSFSVRLPPEETESTLAPGQEMAGPALMVTLLRQTDEMNARAEWMAQRAALARNLYGGPPPSYPLSYNNWYVNREKVNSEFLKRQVESMGPYGFDAFVIDMGWYAREGDWTPHPNKFKPGELESLLRSVKAKGTQVGLWTSPQFVRLARGETAPAVEEPDVESRGRRFLDLGGCDFTRRLTEHMALLRERFGITWWKYDQRLFAAQTRSGVMRNVAAFQDALLAVRKANPDLTIENCFGGGRLINEFTLLATQCTWLLDGGDNDLKHARTNAMIALRAMDFVFPWAAERWTNNFQKMDPDDDELTRFYCRSAMAGTWGICSDLGAIPDRQRGAILTEIKHYRRLNRLKTACVFEIEPPSDRDVAWIAFYDRTGPAAGAVLYRWSREGEFDYALKLRAMPAAGRYRIEDVDTGEILTMDGATLREEGVRVRFPAQRRSAILFLQAER